MTEPLRPTPTPHTHSDGRITTCSTTSPTTFGVRACVHVHSSKVIPIIFVPGIMGSNIKTDSRKTKQKSEQAWRPPNRKKEAAFQVGKWHLRTPKDRQKLLNPDTTVVDEDGPVCVNADEEKCVDRNVLLKRGWGSVHQASYGDFLHELQSYLNQTFVFYSANRSANKLQPHWEEIIRADKNKWGAADMAPLTEGELKKFAEYHYPVYAVGYNWLRCCSEAADLLARKIDAWVAEWRAAHHQCDKVILVSHSLGGLVCRAYTKKHPGKVLGVIHGVQPATGAPLCYRRIACGTEQSSPGNGFSDILESAGFSIIAGRTPAETQPVLAVSPGPLELLPSHLYPPGWLKAFVKSNKEVLPREVLSLPKCDPYREIYLDMSSWYRLIDPSLIDPGDKHKKERTGSIGKFMKAIKEAEFFHKQTVGNYYHPKTFAFYCHDPARLSFGSIRWAGVWDGNGPLNSARLVRAPAGLDFLHPIDAAIETGIDTAKWFLKQGQDAAAAMLKACGVKLPPDPIFLSVQAPDAPGDGTVPWQSGASPAGKSGVLRIFRTTGYSHQGVFNDANMRQLTFHLICKIAQDAS